MYPVYSQMFGARVTKLNMSQRTAARLSPSALSSGTAFNPKLLCLPNPDSPTGTSLDPDVLREILADCEAAGTCC